MSVPSRAIFLSYASQDAEAARRLCDALRAAGLEVWFDQSELRGGDAWDASIRRQIKECALFVPIISANTQSRTEGYFRREWNLAVQRMLDMADDQAFLLPVVIDDTPDNGARVPERFRERQWTRIPEGRCDPAFVNRLKQLLSDNLPTARGPAANSPAEPKPSKGPSRRTVAIVAAVVLVSLVPVLGGLLVALVGKPDAAKPPATAAPTPGSAAERVAKARALLDEDPLLTRRNVELAEQFVLEAIAKDPSSAEAFAAAAWVNYRFLERGYEDTPKRRADLRSYAEKAKLLAPDSVNAELAACGLLMVNGNWTEANRRMEKLVERAPSNLTVLRAALSASASHHGTAFDSNRMPEASLERLRAHSPLGRSYADVEVVGVHWRKAEYVEADRLLDAMFASGHPVARAYILRLLVLAFGWGDLAASRQFAATIPSTLLLEDAFINHLSTLELYSGDYAKALETLGRSQRAVLKEGSVEIPAARLRGDVHEAAGRSAAAALQWREALKTIDALLAIRPDEAYLRRQKAILLAKLGERKEAAAEFALARELAGKPAAGTVDWSREARYHVAIGDKDGAIARLDRLLQRDVGRWPNIYNDLRHDPALRALHGDPRVKAMLERGARWLAEMKKSARP